MHAEFGADYLHHCKDCSYFLQYEYRGRKYKKCKVYGITNSEGSDWLASGSACGLFPDKPYGQDKELIRLVTREAPKERQVQGQTSIFEFLEK